MNQELITVAEILRPHGRKGDLRLRLHTDHPETLLEADRVFVGRDQIEPVGVEKIRLHKDIYLMKLMGIDTIDDAEGLRGFPVMLPRHELVPLEEGEFFLHDLVGLNVLDRKGADVGRTVSIMETGGTPVLVVDSRDHGEVLIPFSGQSVDRVDLENGLLYLKDLSGLLELNTK